MSIFKFVPTVNDRCETFQNITINVKRSQQSSLLERRLPILKFSGKPTKQFCLLPWLKSQSTRGASQHPAFMGNCQTVSHKFYSPMYPVDEGNDNVGSVSDNILLFLELFDF